MEKKKLGEFSPHLFLVGIVAVVAVVALVLQGSGITGEAIGKIYTKEYQAACVDDDPNNDPFTAGTVRLYNTVYSDYCVDGMVHQFKCGETGASKRYVKTTPVRRCLNDRCENGACLDEIKIKG